MNNYTKYIIHADGLYISAVNSSNLVWTSDINCAHIFDTKEDAQQVLQNDNATIVPVLPRNLYPNDYRKEW